MNTLAAPGKAPLRIAMLTHSVNPRGGVVHALQLSESLQALGHQVTLFAPDARGRGLFRQASCAFHAIPGPAHTADVADMVRQRIADYLRCFERPGMDCFDIWHAQDSISANAMATLAERGAIPGYVRTVHHLDTFEDPRLHAWQERGYRRASRLLCVSRMWQDILWREHGLRSELVGNGVDAARYSPQPSPRDAALRAQAGLHGAPLLLAVGGIEPRKNTLGILRAFLRLHRVRPAARLVIAGGASVLDHQDYRHRFDAELSAAALAPGTVRILGQVDDADMPPLMRCADALVFPSLKEGFGLVALEAMACGIPAVVPRIAPFTEHLDGSCCAWADPEDPASIAAAMAHACDPAVRTGLIAAGREVAARFTWMKSALRHQDIYHTFRRDQAAHAKEESHA
ncbi:MSMEG_0565 family glycosyltransferase [Herbaspirillum sp. WKF16]|uniref:MSMEG_0565 family glycosyltransferase n=1 Tax=Herbaspirillum sp. WKF16 TaxID=3028312 RepID=UPI0023A9829F|nr:MSMEG_0565 family glycosyltransferase [Herbaspirillum sp. WKF16]WDZ94177.1 MSMEG_0565 family glycosyltransferase [Herbaspirillum sp. WKF16]